ncbi:MAG: methylmalonyl-CoA mutase family protein [Firmicutes bacterium]|nr:methylmalonyl-CoA mutase family protein [Bacillota bacterium]
MTQCGESGNNWAMLAGKWRTHTYQPFISGHKERCDEFRTVSGEPVGPIYGPYEDWEDKAVRDLGFPGEFPYTRGVYPSMYRGRLWTFRQIAGFSTAEETNQRYHYLLRQGQTGLSTDFDHPTLTGYDSTDPLALGEVGRLGVAIDTVRDMDDLMRGIDLSTISCSFTINHPACVLFPMFLAVAESRDVSWKSLRGTTQNDAIKEFYGQKTFALPPRASVRLALDLVEYAAKYVPKWNAINVSGYHTREAGATAVQEVAFTIGQGLAYAEGLQQRGIDLNIGLQNMSFFFGCHLDFFEEVAKFRAARRLWARLVKERFGITSPKALQMRFHTQTLGSTLARREPKNNIIRGTFQALAAILGGTQSLHISGYDEAYDIPSEDAMKMSIRTQQVLGMESGVANIVDPLGGAFAVEYLTDRIESEVRDYLRILEQMGDGSFLEGMFNAVESGFIEREISESAMAYQRKIDSGELPWVAENIFKPEEDESSDSGLEFFTFDESTEEKQKARLTEFLRNRDSSLVAQRLQLVREVAENGMNAIPAIFEAVKVGATEGEVMGLFRNIFGEYQDPAVY